MRTWKEGKILITIKEPWEIKVMREGGIILGWILEELAKKTAAGISTGELDRIAEELMKKKNVKASFKGYRGFPFATCISINDEVVHGLPGKRIVKDGDLVKIDCGVIHKGFHTDSAITVGVGVMDEKKQKFIATAEKALKKAIEKARPGIRIKNLSEIIQKTVEKNGFSVVRDLVGHGIGHNLHEDPQIPNFVDRDPGPILQVGMTLAIEPIITMGDYDVKVRKDGWTYVTADGSLAAHTEHTIAITQTCAEILTKRAS
jgi:methionyl aminopeptidase